MKEVRYEVQWEEMWAYDRIEFSNLEEAVRMAKMKKAMNYKNVKLVKVEREEMEF